MANTKLSAFFSLLLVFCSGAVVGVAGYRVYNTRVAPSPRPQEKRPTPEEFRKQLIDEMTKEVQLDDQQVARLRQIYEETRIHFDELRGKLQSEGNAIHEEQIQKIREMLRPSQIPLYETLRTRKEAERAAREANDRKQGHRKGPGGVKKD